MRQFVIRDATKEDIGALVLIGERFFDESRFADVMQFDPDSLRDTLEKLIEDPDGIVLVAAGPVNLIGVAGGLVHPSYFNRAHITGQELFWWVDPDRRGVVGSSLFDALELEARTKGARSWAMIALSTLNPDGVGQFYERHGYRPSERTYIKALEA